MRAPHILFTGCMLLLIAAMPTRAGAAAGGSTGRSPSSNGPATTPAQGNAYPAPVYSSGQNGPVTTPAQGNAYPAPTQPAGGYGPVTTPVQGNAYPAPVQRQMPPTGRQPLPTGLPAPTNLLAHNDPQSCSAYGGFAGGLACAALLPKGGLAFVWQYGKNQIDGFRLYAVPNPRMPSNGGGGIGSYAIVSSSIANKPVGTQTARLGDGTVARLIILDPRPHGFENDCFAATAYLGATESAMSLPFCVGSNATARSASFSPIHSLTVKNELFIDVDKHDSAAPCCDTESNDPDPFRYGAVLFAGHFRQALTTNGRQVDVGVQRAALLYDVSSLHGARISKAVLHFTRESSGGFSCISEIDPAPANWWVKAPGYLPTLSPQWRRSSIPDRLSTSTSRQWSAAGWRDSPTTDRPCGATLGPAAVYQLLNITDTCVTSLKNVTLEVTYF